MKAKNISVSLYDAGNGELRVHCAGFTIKGSLSRKDGIVNEQERRKKQNEIERILSSIEF